MPEFHQAMTIPIGDAGQVHIEIDITDLDVLTPHQRQVLADTGREFAEFAAGAVNPQPGPLAKVHDPSSAVLDGVRGTRRNTS